ncbi:MAG: outer membrane beta-barrel protein [Desulfobacterales bacterium]|nr:outer membrane beta-barrel protein [Desulfobacterales bacterium]
MIKIKQYITNVYFLTVYLVLFFCTFPGFAKEFKIQYGDFKILPKIDYNCSYSTNIYSDNTNRQNDFIHTITPGISLEKGFASHNKISAEYSIALVTYNDLEENNSQDHSLSVSSELKFPAAKTSLNIADNFTRTSDLLGTDNEYNVGKKTKRWNNSLDTTLAYDFGGKYSLELTYNNTILRFDDDEDKRQNRFDNKYGVYLFYKLTGKTSVFTNFQQTLAEYDDQGDATSQDYTLNDYLIGIRLKPVGRLHGEASFGYSTNKPDNYGNTSSWTANASVNFETVNKTLLSYSLKRAYKGAPDEDAPSYLDTSMDISLTRSFVNEMSVDFSLNWGHMDYKGEEHGLPDKSFNKYSAKAGFNWKIVKWINAGVGYEYGQKTASDSKYEDEEHEINNMYFNFDFNFDF